MLQVQNSQAVAAAIMTSDECQLNT